MRHAWTILVAVLLAPTFPSFAQIRLGGWEVEAAVSYSVYDRGTGLNAEIVDHDYSAQYERNDYTTSYHSHPLVLPTFSVRAGYHFPETFVGLFLNAYCSYARNALNGGPSPLLEREAIFHVLPEVRFYYLSDPAFQLYASVAAGLRYRQFAETFEGDTIANHDFRLSYQISPFGVSVGDRWFFSVDLGVGAPWSIAKIGAGYRF